MALKVGELYQTLEIKDQGFDSAMSGAKSKTSSLATMLGPQGALIAATVGIGAAFVGMAKSGLENMKEIDNAAKDFEVAMGASADEVEEFSNTIQSLHKVNTDSYEEIGDAVLALRQKHGEASEGMEQDFLDYAKVTGQDTAKAVEELHAVQHSWGLNLADQTEVMDKFKSVAGDTGADVGSLQSTMAELGPIAEGMGLGFDETLAMLGHFEKAGINSETATRGLRNAMVRLEDPTKAQAEALRKLGIKVEDVEGGFYKVSDDAFPQLMQRLSDGELSSGEMSAALEILGRRAGVDMVNAFKDGEIGINDLMEIISNSEGTVASASETYDKKLGERWELIKRKYLEPFMETLGTGLMTILEDLLGFAETWGPKVSNVFKTITDVVTSLFGDSGDAPTALTSFTDTLSNIFTTAGEIVGILADHFNDFWELFGEDIIGGINTTIEGLGIVFDTVFGTIEGLLETVAGVLTGDFTRAVEGITGTWDTVWTGVKDFILNFSLIDPIMEVTGNMVDYITDELPEKMRQGATNFMKGMVQGIVDSISAINKVAGFAAQKVADKLMGQSPPKEGPLSEIDQGGYNIGVAWAEGISKAEHVIVAVANGISLAAAAELLTKRVEFEKLWSDAYRDETESRLEELQREKTEALKTADELGADKADITLYYDKLIDEERQKLAEDEEQRREEALQDVIDKNKTQKENEREKWDAITQYHQDLRDEQVRLDEEERKMYEDKFGFLEGEFEGFFTDVFDGTKKVTDAFGDLWEGVIDEIIKKLAKMAASKVFDIAINLLTGGTGGTILGTIGNIFGGIFHDGGKVPGKPGEEKLILAKAGEMFFPPDSLPFSTDNLRMRQNNSQGGRAVYITIDANYDIKDRQTAEYANTDLIRKLQRRGLEGALR